jgi:serine/threonine protein kinase
LLCRLKDQTLSLVKIADFGLSDFYRPGATMKSSCGTLSFLAPEVFKGTANAGKDRILRTSRW